MRWICLLTAFALVAGCHRGPTMAPVTGKVFYNGRPLEFGSVMFQPASGQPAQGQIQSDGTFTLSTYKEADGAVVGRHKVRITCYETEKPGFPRSPGEQTLGRLLIPEKYTFLDQSGLSADVSIDREEPFVFELEGPKG